MKLNSTLEACYKTLEKSLLLYELSTPQSNSQDRQVVPPTAFWWESQEEPQHGPGLTLCSLHSRMRG